jgi:hypothetical protein
MSCVPTSDECFGPVGYKDVSNSGAIFGWSAKANCKDIILVLSGNM